MKTISPLSLFSLLLLFSACLLPAEERHKLVPAGAPYSFTAAPDREHAYPFTAPKLPEGGECRWNLTDLAGRELQQGSISVAQGRGEVKLTLPAGYYRLRFPELEQTFGLSVLSPFDGMPDPFFAIEALLEGTSPELTDSCLKLLHRGGVRSNREWTQFHSLNPAEGVTSDRNDRVYREGGALGIGSIFAFHDFPAWLDGFGASTRKCLPGKLIGLDSALERMLTARRDGLEGFQILNEYDLHSVPAEACLPPLKTAAWAARRFPELKLVGAAFCKGSSVSERDSIRSGMLDFLDAFAIHTYAEPEQAVPLIEEYRRDMKSSPRGLMPIRVTESGKAWSRGHLPRETYGGPVNNLRPADTDEELLSALWITMKGVEFKACGVEKYYPFVLRFFQENDNNFGMLDYYGAPLAPLHSYLFSIKMLAGKRYAGDWKQLPAGLHSARIFSDGAEAVAVLYAGRDGVARREISVADLPVGRAFGIDGAELKPADGKLSFRGGMAYLTFPAEQLRPGQLNTSTPAMALLKESERYVPTPRRATPLIYRYDFRKSGAEWRNFGNYRIPPDGRLFFTVANLSEEPVVTRPKLEVPGDVRVLQGPPETLTLPPRSETPLEVVIANEKALHFPVRLGDAADPLSATRVPFVDPSRLRAVELDYRTLSRWNQNSSGKQTFLYDGKEQAVRVDTDFRNKRDPKTNNWSFPEFRFTDAEKRDGLSAVSFEFKYDNGGVEEKPLFPLLMLARKGQKKYESYTIEAPQREWKEYMIPVAADSPAARDILRIGMGARDEQLTFWFRNVKLWY